MWVRLRWAAWPARRLGLLAGGRARGGCECEVEDVGGGGGDVGEGVEGYGAAAGVGNGHRVLKGTWDVRAAWLRILVIGLPVLSSWYRTSCASAQDSLVMSHEGDG